MEQLIEARQTVLADLLAWRTEDGHWVGRLSASALSTATAASALALVDRHASEGPRYQTLIDRAVDWLRRHVNDDGGWGDTDRSRSNLATTMLALAAFHLAGAAETNEMLLRRAGQYVVHEGGIGGLRRRYGRDRTFAVPILTNCALAGLVPWSEVAPLPFELACLPHGLLRFLRLPVVSYALPALVAVGQVRYYHRRPFRSLLGVLRHLAVGPSLKRLRAMQPASGGYLEAVPLTSFVVMSLAATGRVEHPVVRDGARFLVDSVRDDGSWPIDMNLATWNTTLAINALPDDILASDNGRLHNWLLDGQHCSAVNTAGDRPRFAGEKDVRVAKELRRRKKGTVPLAAAGGWGWTNLSGAVPDADDTAGALLALARLEAIKDAVKGDSPLFAAATVSGHVNASGADKKGTVRGAASGAARDGVLWLLRLQNADGGWPTFCRGWGTLPFDRSGTDLTAHAIRALHVWRKVAPKRIEKAVNRGLAYLSRTQQEDGSWVPLWFGNEHHPNEENPIYGTGRVLLAYRDLRRLDSVPSRRGIAWLCAHQNADGGWGGDLADVSSVEETAVAVEAVLAARETHSAQVAAGKGLAWLVRAVADGRHRVPSPIGFYFARLWYYESMYPLVFALSALEKGTRNWASGIEDSDRGLGLQSEI